MQAQLSTIDSRPVLEGFSQQLSLLILFLPEHTHTQTLISGKSINFGAQERLKYWGHLAWGPPLIAVVQSVYYTCKKRLSQTYYIPMFEHYTLHIANKTLWPLWKNCLGLLVCLSFLIEQRIYFTIDNNPQHHTILSLLHFCPVQLSHLFLQCFLPCIPLKVFILHIVGVWPHCDTKGQTLRPKTESTLGT